MYEIWLTLNILYELMWMYLPAVVVLLLVLALVYGRALQQKACQWRAAIRPTAMVAVVVAVLSLWLVPASTHATLADMAYWVDWANLIVICAGVGLVAAAIAWPMFSLQR